ncbi:alkaline phosphatase D family protein [Rhodococcus phenolicus]|uniref:alkaline phosphatase D family protein n=1 Tax=Rhodococcus phenolicus TaxID=263849 RepID=UPI00083098AD|nr:alkaline phosphatase D family protein [Rhodococcus phenolicus]
MPTTSPGPRVSRRVVLRSGALAAGVAALGSTVPASAAPNTFAHGVASGDPLPDRVVLWTRVTPAPEATPGSGLGPDTTVRWEIAPDEEFRAAAASGTATATAASDHTVKIDAAGLEPDTTYFYRFTVVGSGAVSPTGRTRTAPADDARPGRLRFGVVSCANWEDGFFASYRHLAARTDLDAIVHLGDYLYEYGTGEYAPRSGPVRRHAPAHEILTLADYRVRHGEYKTDPDLQALHALLPWIVTWDDHESANDSWSGGAENHQPAAEGAWAERIAAARRAYLEWMPVRVSGTEPRLYRRLRFGDLAELSMLDLRSYRSEQVGLGPGLREIDDPARTITGAEQMSWLTAGITSSPTRWQLVGNPVMFSPLLIPPLDARTTAALTELAGVPAAGVPVNTDQWDGYPADRQRLLDAIVATGGLNVVFLTGDIHTSWACDVPVDAAAYPTAGSVATELVLPSVTSQNIDDILGTAPRTASVGIESAVRDLNRHVRYVELDSHGYGVLEVTPDAVQMDWMYVLDRADPATGARLGASMRVPAGSARVEPAAPLDPVVR